MQAFLRMNDAISWQLKLLYSLFYWMILDINLINKKLFVLFISLNEIHLSGKIYIK